MTTHEPLTLVLGGTGKTGRRVVEKLTAGGRPVRIGSRSGEPPFDWDDPATWAGALSGVEAIYVTWQPDLTFPGAAEQITELVSTAQRSGVRRAVLLSGRNEEAAVACEAAVRASGLDWTVVRSAFFNQNFSETFLLTPILDGVLAFPAGTVSEPFVDVDDIADVAVAALGHDEHLGEVYEVTGPRLLTFGDAIGDIAAASGRAISYVPISTAEFADGLRAEGVPDAEVAAYSKLFATVLDGRNAYLGDGVQRALGREPLDFRAYAAATAATGVWDAPASVVSR